MRTTVTLDADVASEIERIQKAEGKGFKRVLNELVRDGLRQRAGQGQSTGWKSPTHPRDLGRALFDISSTSRALDYAEGEDHK
jgi:hypothetical protein